MTKQGEIEILLDIPPGGIIMKRNEDIKKKLLHRLKISKGHLEKVIQMVEDDTYCIDVIHQSKAIQSALSKVDSSMLENHLNTCVVEDIKKGKSKKAIDEIMEVFKKKS